MSHVAPVQVQRSVLKEKTSREKAMEQAVQWISPVTTSIAAVMVALNGGARLTGYGLVVFAIGPLAWCDKRWLTAEDSRLIQEPIRLAVNPLGCWRWLSRQVSSREVGESARGAREEQRSR